MKSDTYEIVTNKILAQLEKGVVPWRNPRKGRAIAGQFAQNLVSHRPYHGCNFWILNYGTEFKSPYWLSFKQAIDLGGNVRKGEHGTPVVFWKFFQTENKETGKTKNIPMLRYYTVFNLEQTENVKQPEPVALPDFHPIESAQAILDAMPNKPKIETGEPQRGGSAGCYSPSDDTVTMPDARDFRSSESFYAVLFHELGHATGHRTRLDRMQGDTAWSKFGSKPYAQEELVAELTSGYLCATCQIFDVIEENTAAYIGSWIKTLKNDSTLFVHAAGKAQHAADWILNTRAEQALLEAAA
jgi:antirestriction protein ArdC